MKSTQPKSDRQRLNIYITDEVDHWLAEHSKQLQMSKSQIVARLLNKIKHTHEVITFKDLA